METVEPWLINQVLSIDHTQTHYKHLDLHFMSLIQSLSHCPSTVHTLSAMIFWESFLECSIFSLVYL